VTGPLRIGLIGCGRAAERLWLPTFRAVGEARLTAVVDPRAERGDLIASAMPTCRRVESPEALFGGGDVDAVIVATPAETHFALACSGIQAGIPLLVEKPLVSTVNQALELEALRQATKATVMVGFNRRWWLPIRRLREQLQGRGPSPVQAELVFVTQADRWAAVAGVPDLLDDLATHQLDLLRFLLGHEIGSVAARRIGGRDVRMEVSLSDGSVATCRVSHDGSPEESVRVAAEPLSAWIYAKSDRMVPPGGATRFALDLGGRAWRRLAGRPSSLLRSFEYELRGFIATIRERTEPNPGVQDAIAVARAVAAARRSLATGGLPVTP